MLYFALLILIKTKIRLHSAAPCLYLPGQVYPTEKPIPPPAPFARTQFSSHRLPLVSTSQKPDFCLSLFVKPRVSSVLRDNHYLRQTIACPTVIRVSSFTHCLTLAFLVCCTLNVDVLLLPRKSKTNLGQTPSFPTVCQQNRSQLLVTNRIDMK